MRIQRRYLLFGVALLVLACLEIVFQPVRLKPHPKEFHIRVEFSKPLDDIVPAEGKSDLSRYVSDTVFSKYDDVEDAQRVGSSALMITCRKATKPEARALLEDVRKELKNKLKVAPRSAVITDLNQLGETPRKTLWRLALYKPRPHIRLGLDLQGGSHIVLQIRRAFFEYRYERPLGETDRERDESLNKLRTALDKNGIKDADVKPKMGESNTVSIHTQPGSEKEFNRQKDEIVRIVGRLGAEMNLGKAEPTRTAQYYPLKMGALEQTAEIIRRRVDGLGVAEASIQTELPDRIIVELPGVKNLEEAKQAIGETAQLRFHLLPKRFEPVYHERERVSFKESGREVSSDKVFEASAKEFRDYVITGDELEPNVQGGFSGNPTHPNEPAVHLNLRPSARKKFAVMTTKYAPQGGQESHIAIFLDRECISAPRINEPITGGAVEISGGFRSIEEANKLATQLNAGALPAPVDIVEERTVSPSLGADSVRKSLFAGLAGLVTVVLFMLTWYRLPGALANVALGIYCILNLAILVLAQATLTLPGIAGFILAMGMSVDTNVLIFERLKEELDTDKTFKAALQAAFHRAWTAILDSHVTTAIAAAVLLYYGTGPIKGFGLTLLVGVLSSLFTANTITRLFVYTASDTALANNRRLWFPARWLWGKFGRGFHVGKVVTEKTHIDLVGRRNLWFAISLVGVVIGLVACVLNRTDPNRKAIINLGIDFTGGALFQYQVPKSALQGKSVPRFLGEVREALEKDPQLSRKLGNPQLTGDNILFVRTQAQDNAQRDAHEKAVTRILKEKFSGTGDPLQKELVGPTVGRELRNRAFWGVFWGCVLIMAWIWIRYNVQHDGFRYGVAGIVALVHDVLIMVGGFALVGRLFPSVEADSAFVAALLTVVGYSINDSVVIFDRIRENLRLRRRDPYDEIVNDSLWETMARSINTVLTVEITLLALFLFGGVSIHNFTLAMLIGITSGAYSSIFNASQILVAWRKWDDKRKQAATPARRTTTPEPQKPAPRPAQPSRVTERPVAAVKETPAQVTTAPSEPLTTEEEEEEGVPAVTAGGSEAERAKKRKAAKRGKRKRRY